MAMVNTNLQARVHNSKFESSVIRHQMTVQSTQDLFKSNISTDQILKRFLGRKDEHISAQLQFTSLLDLDIVECTAEVDSFLKE